MRKPIILALTFVIAFSTLSISPLILSSQNDIQEYVVVTYATPATDDSMSNPDYGLLGYRWTSSIHYYVNPSNPYGFTSAQVENTVTTSANTWDLQTTFQVFSYDGATNRRAGKRDGFNVVSWGKYSRGAIAVTYVWAKSGQILETDLLMNTRYIWSVSKEPNKMDVQNIMTHEFGHWCGLKDLYQDKDYWLTMYGYGDYGETYKSTLGNGDILGLRAVYGS